MPIKLDQPLSWKNADHEEQRMLRVLQGNILKGHGRNSTINIFFQIDAAMARQMRASIREIANYHVTSAIQQLVETEQYHENGQSGSPFVSLFLSASGYAALGVPKAHIPDDPSFLKGMKAATLGDSALADWEAPFQDRIDGMVLIGSENDSVLRLRRDAIAKLLEDGGAAILIEQHGQVIRNKVNDGIEHFGYVDGRSLPLLLVEDLDTEARDAGIGLWDPTASLDLALVQDPGVELDADHPDNNFSFGSYFIFRKLSQNVLEFKRREQELADALKLEGDKRELAGALVVGRFEDGTPVTMSDEPKSLNPPNDFNYDGDPSIRCPFHAHIRKTNPRGTGGFEDKVAEAKHLLVRRGIPYENKRRLVHPSDLPDVDTLEEFNEKVAPLLQGLDVGLLFMAYNSDLAKQFEFTQNAWANNSGFPKDGPPPKLDPVIGQGSAKVDQPWPLVWDDPAKGTVDFSFQDFVSMRGGEYFFAPSLTFLKSL